MAVLEEFSADLDGLLEVVQGINQSVRKCGESIAPSVTLLQGEKEKLPQAQSGARGKLGDLASDTAGTQTKLAPVQTELDKAAETASTELRHTVDTLASLGKDAQAQVQALTAALRSGVAGLETSAADLKQRAAGLSSASASEKQVLADASGRLVAVLREGEQVVKTGIEAGLFENVSDGLGKLQSQLHKDSETLPATLAKLKTEVQQGHEQKVQAGLDSFTHSVGRSLQDFGGQVMKPTFDLQGQQTTRMTALEKLISHELPEVISGVMTREVDGGLRGASEEAAKLWLGGGNLAAYLNKEQDPFLPAVRELHRALENMTKG